MLPIFHDLGFWCSKDGYTHSWNKDCKVHEMCYPHKSHYGINIAFKIECSFHHLTLWVILRQWNFFPLEGLTCIAHHPQSMETSWKAFSAFLHFLVALSRESIFHSITSWRFFSEGNFLFLEAFGSMDVDLFCKSFWCLQWLLNVSSIPLTLIFEENNQSLEIVYPASSQIPEALTISLFLPLYLF